MTHGSARNVSYSELRRTLLEADALRYDGPSGFNRFLPIMTDPMEDCLDAWTLLSALAAHMKNLKVHLLATCNNYRDPALVAKVVATVDHVGNGRLILILGVGWFELEHGTRPVNERGVRSTRSN